MGIRPIHHLMIALYPPEGSAVTLSCSVPEPDALRLRQAIAGASQETVGPVIARHLANGFHAVDRIEHNRPTNADGSPLAQLHEDDLIAIAEGRKIVILQDGKPVIVDEADELWPGTEAEARRLGIDDGSVSGEKHRGS